jgi:hypothetical protein
MISASGIAATFELLNAAGYKPPQDLTQPSAMKAAVLVWSMVWGDQTDDALQHATIAFLREAKAFWPKPGELLAMVPGARAELVDEGDLAWGTLIQCVRRYGTYRPPGIASAHAPRDEATWDLRSVFEERTAAAEAGLLAVGGWQALCRLEDEGVMAARAAFRTAFRGVVTRGALAIQEQAVAGLLDGRVADPQLVARARALPGGVDPGLVAAARSTVPARRGGP